MDEASLRETMCRVGRRLWERGLVGACEGNLSARLPDGSVLSTPSGVSKGHLTPGDLVVLMPDGRSLTGGKPSSEIRMHLRCYARRPDCLAVVHAHPPVATAFTVADRPIPSGVLPEADLVLGPVAQVPFSMPGTDEVPDRLEPFLPGHKTFLLSHHGAATLGRDLWEACDRMETLERVAKVLLGALQLGGVVPLPEAAAEEIARKGLHGRLS
ncbi:MAG: class II aldolase/adducin family protein [Fimbriimonadaceae bacterium]|nr:class II aldolase/adducin family protein [Fimbriimonadaceae bacterium]